MFFFFKQKTAYEVRISDWRSDVCSSDLAGRRRRNREAENGLEVGEAIVAAEAGFVAEEQEHAGEGQRLGHDREVIALDPRAEGEEAEDEGQHAGHKHYKSHGSSGEHTSELQEIMRQSSEVF